MRNFIGYITAILMVVLISKTTSGQCPVLTPVITTNGNSIICTGQSVVLNAPEAASYFWSNGATTSSVNISTGGNYTVTITDSSGCVYTSSPFPVTSYNTTPPQPVIISSLGFEYCDGQGSTTLSTTESYPFYLWNNLIYYAESIEAHRSGTYTLTVKNAQGCSGSASQVINIKSNPQVSIQADGPTTFCPGNTLNLSVNTGTSYSWNTGSTSSSIPVNTSGNYSVTVTQENGCTSSASQTVTVQTLEVPLINHYNGTTICGAFGYIDFEIANFNPFVTYTWSDGVNTDYADYNYFYIVSPGTYTVTAQDGFGCSTSNVINIAGTPGNASEFGNNQWNISVFSTGDFQDNGYSWVADNYTGFYTEPNISFDTRDRWNADYEAPSNADGYQGCQVGPDYHSWSAKRKGFPCGIYEISIPGHDDEAQLFIDGVLVWSHSDCCDAHTNVWTGNLDANSEVEYRVTEGDGGSWGSILFTKIILAAPDTILSTGLGICEGQTTTLSIPDSSVVPGTVIKWFKGSCNSTILVGTGNSIHVSPTSTAVYTAKAYGTCDISACRSVTVTVIKTVPGTPGGIVQSGGSAKVCPGYIRTYTTSYAPYVKWVWTIPTGSQIISGDSTNTITLLFDSAFVSSGVLSVYKVNCFGSGTSRSITINRNLPSTPSKISGPALACAGSVQNYSIVDLSGNEFLWTSDVPEITYPAGQGTTSVTASFSNNFTSGYIYVQTVNSCGTSNARYLKVGSATATPGAITGPSIGSCGQLLEYYVPYVAGITYNWKLNGSEANIISGQGTNMVMVNFPIVPTSSILTVTASNGCTESSVRSKTISAMPPKPEQINGETLPCENSSYTYQVSSVPTAIAYTWTSPWGSTISDGSTTSTSNSITTTSTNVTVYYTTIPLNSKVTVRATNLCGSSVLSSLAVSACGIIAREPVRVSEFKNEFSVYPNPADEILTLSFSKAITTRIAVRISDAKGTVVINRTLNNYTGEKIIPIDVSMLAPGTYLLQVNNNGMREVRKILIR